MLSFAVVAARPGHEIPPWAHELLGRPAPDELPYGPIAHTTWASSDGRVLVAAWEEADRLGIGRRWHDRPSGFTVFGGMTWHRATPWGGTTAWAAQLADLFERVPLRSALAELDGLFTAASVAPDGSGTVTADPLGLMALYRAEGDDVVVASNRAALAARLVTPPAHEPTRDRDAMAWLVLGGSLMEGRTGYEAVRRVPEGCLLDLAPERPLDVVTWDERPWWPGPPVPAADRAAVIDAAGGWVRELLRVHAGLPSHRRRMDLSGGHDSRLVLALLLQEGLEHRFNYVTWGSQALPDVEVATELAERYLLNHNGPGQRRPFRGPQRAPGPCAPEAPAGRAGAGAARPHPSDPPGFVAAARHHCWVTSGGLSVWDRTLGRGRPAPDVSLTGDLGELLRPRHPASGGFADLDEVRTALRAGWLHLDPAGLLHRDVRRDLLDRVVAQVEAARGEGGSVQDAMDGFYLRNRLRPWIGVVGEHDRRNPVTPFAALRTIRAAFSLGPDARRDELLAFTLVRAADPDLARHRFAGAGWPSQVVAGLEDAATYPTTPVGTGWAPPRRPGPVAAVRRLRAPRQAEGSMREEQRQAAFGSDLAGLAELVDLGAGHALFDVVDRRALGRALRRADPSFASRRALYDVATAAIWLDRGECEVAGLSRR